MKLVNGKKILIDAQKSNQAIGAFNFTNLEQLHAILTACEEKQHPVIVQASKSAIDYMGLETCVAMVKTIAKNLTIPVCLNLDHGTSFEICKKAIDAGFTNVMIDGSSLPFEENVTLTKKVVKYAHKKGVTVEAELGALKGVEDEVNHKQSHYTDPQEALKFVTLTKVDSLAVSIGTSHGAYKFEGKGLLDIKRLKEIYDLIQIPLVLHGASSVPSNLVKKFNSLGGSLNGAKGVSTLNLKKAINNGICKINVDTDLRIAFTIGVKECLIKNNTFNLRDYLTCGKENILSLVKEKIDIFKNN